MNILETIVEKTRLREAESKRKAPLTAARALAERAPEGENFPFERALAAEGVSFICEVKKASPSKGLLAPDFPYPHIARDYEKAGASAVSVLTEPDFFQGSDAYLKEIAQTVSIPCLRKDFTVDAYQIYEAKLLGAAAVLLICALLDETTLREFIQTAGSLGLSALVEARGEAEVEKALAAGARIVGVNNRDLKTFKVDLQTCVRLRKLVPPDVLFVAESGIENAAHVQTLRAGGADAVLIGEALMRAADKKAALKELRGAP
jgi:indole-3-glycerol phosphate synthase